MTLIPWRPFWDMERWFEEEPEFWTGPRLRIPTIKTPRANVYETDKELIIEAELPGADPKKINVDVENDVLRIEAKTEEKKEEKKKGYYRKEIITGSYKRVMPLPKEVIGGKAKADYEDGILKISIPKKKVKEEKKKVIKIKVKKNKK